MDISPGKPLPVVLQGASDSDRQRMETQLLLLQRVGRVESIALLGDNEEPPVAATALLGDMRLLVPMKGLIDIDAERARLTKHQDKIKTDLQRPSNLRNWTNSPDTACFLSTASHSNRGASAN